MSALPPIADIGTQWWNVRFVPKADISIQLQARLLTRPPNWVGHPACGEQLLWRTPILILFTDSLGVGFAVRIEEVLAALLPRRLEFGRCDVPVWPAFLGNGA
jgi:hypothetical protein